MNSPSSPLIESKPTAPVPPPVMRESRRAWLPILAITLGVLIAYANCYNGVFILDDTRSIQENTDIHDLTDVWRCLFGGSNISRPVVSLTFAINYAIGPWNPIGYHVFNVLIHLLAALALYGVARRTLLKTQYAEHSTLLGGALALLWGVHPLQTQSVTYIVQRSEAMMGMFLFLTLYCFIRATDSESPAAPRRKLWLALSIGSCVLGMASKQSMFAAPLLVLLYDRTFVARSFSQAMRRHWGVHLLLFASWGVLAMTVFMTPSLLGAGFGQTAITPLQYLLSQAGVLLHYLALSLWPAELCLDYYWPVAKTAREIVPGGIVILTLLGLTVWALIKRPAWGFVGATFFLVLAPTSSVMPIVDLCFEQRMYVPLAAVLCAVVFALFEISRTLGPRAVPAFTAMTACIAVALGARTLFRNADYLSEVAIWGDTVEKAPHSPRAHNNYGLGLYRENRLDEAEAHYLQALEIEPEYWQAVYNLGLVYEDRGHLDFAIERYERTLQLNYVYTSATTRLVDLHNRRGLELRKKGLLEAAEKDFRAALTHDPKFWAARFNLGLIRAQRGDPRDAIACYKAALELNPEYVEARQQLAFSLTDLAVELLKTGHFDPALLHLAEAVRLQPGHPPALKALTDAAHQRGDFERRKAELLLKINAAREALNGNPAQDALQYEVANSCNDMGLLLHAHGKLEEAQAPLREALQTRADFWQAHYNLGLVVEQSGKLDVALAHYREAVRLNPAYAPGRYQLANGLNDLGLKLKAELKPVEAEALFRESCAAEPTFWQARYNLGLVLEMQGRNDAASEAYKEALRLNPGYGPAQTRLGELTLKK